MSEVRGGRGEVRVGEGEVRVSEVRTGEDG